MAGSIRRLIVLSCPFQWSNKTCMRITHGNRRANGFAFDNIQVMRRIAGCTFDAHGFQCGVSTESKRDPSVQLCGMAMAAPSSAPQVYAKQPTSSHLGSIRAVWRCYAMPHNWTICCRNHVWREHWGDRYLTNGKRQCTSIHIAM